VVDDCLKARPALAPMQGHAEVARVRCIKPLNLSGDANVHTHGGAR
jgi:dipeptide transport system ATP-binding protein